MLKLANQILDVYDDVSKEGIAKLAKINPKCELMDDEKRAMLKDHQFALSVITKQASKLNKYPICDSDSTWLSNQYFEMNNHKLPIEARQTAAFNIKTACEKFKIEPTPSVAKFAKTASSNVYFEKDGALKPVRVVSGTNLEKFAQVEDICNNSTVAQYTLNSPAAIKIACKYLTEHEKLIPVEYRHKYAAAIQIRAKELGMPSQKGVVAKYAGDQYSAMVDAHISARASLLDSQPELKSFVTKLGSAKKEYSPSQFAQMLHGFDKKAGLNRYYGAHLQDPFQATFASEPVAFHYKTASQRSLGGDELQKLVNAKYATIKDYFGESIASELKKDPVAIFDSLPNDAKEIIVGIADGTH